MCVIFFLFFFCVICAAGNHQMCRLGQQQRSLHCPFDLPVRYHRGDLFEHVHHVQVSLESYFLIILSYDVKMYILRDTIGTNVSLFFSFLFLSRCVVRGRCVCGFKCGPRVRTKLQPNSAKPSAASLSVWRTRPRCCPLGEPAGLHKGAPEIMFSFFTFPLLYFPPPPLLSCPLTGCKVSSCIIIDIYYVTKRRVLVHMLFSHQRHGF